MKIEIMIYTYIAICVSMIAYNIVYIFILKHREKAIVSDSDKMEKAICEQIERIKKGEEVTRKHERFLMKKLQRTKHITAFDKALEKIFSEETKLCEEYVRKIYPAFEYLTHKYITKDTIKIAYFPYILHKYNVLKHDREENLMGILFELLRSVNVYCRENTLKALYGIGKPEVVVKALKVIDKNLSFHHPKLICDGLLNYKGDKVKLKEKFFERFGEYSVNMQLNILNYLRFANIRCDEKMLEILKGEKTDRELKFSAIRYFEKFPLDEARGILEGFAENRSHLTWEYQAIASSALKSYRGDVTFRILVENLSNPNWHVRQNSAISLEKLGYTYHDLINVFDGNDRYAREIMRYRLDKREAEEEAVKI